MMKVVALVALFLVGPLGCYPARDPAWVRNLVPQLECGMSIEAVAQLTRAEFVELEFEHGWLGQFVAWKGRGVVWLRFDPSGLEAATWGYSIDGKSSAVTPTRNLCTGELTISIFLSHERGREDAQYYLNDRVVDRRKFFPRILVTGHPNTSYTLRAEQQGFDPTEETVVLDESHRGELRYVLRQEGLTLRTEELVRETGELRSLFW